MNFIELKNKIGFQLLIFVVLGFVCFNSETAFSQTQIGLPFIQNYPSTVYKHSPQNWAACQDSRGIMFFGNTDGLLEYDGVNWRLYKVKNNSAVRTMAIGEKNKIFVGASGEFGYFYFNNAGNYQYISLSDKLKNINFNSVWRVYNTTHGVYYFAGRNNIFRYFNDSLIIIKINPDINNFRGFMIRDSIYIIDSKYGICTITNDSLVSHNLCKSVSKKNVYAFIEIEKNKFILGTRNDGLYIFDKNNLNNKDSIKPFKTEVDNYLKQNNLYFGIKLNNNNYAFTTLQGGIVIINSFGELVNILNNSKGLLADDIYFIYLDNNDNMWVTQERGISKVEINSAFTQFNNINGLEGTLISGIIFQNHLYLGTSLGIYHLLDFNIKEANKPRILAPLSKKYNYILDFCPIKNKKGSKEVLLVSSLRNIVQIHDKTKIDEVIPLYGCYSMKPSKRVLGRVFLGHPAGISAIKATNNSNGTINFIDEGQIADFKEDIRLLCIDNIGNLWISTAFNGITYLKFGEEENLTDFEIFRYNKNNGLPANDENKVYNFNGKIIVTTNKGLYRISDQSLILSDPKSIKFVPDTSYLLNFNKDSIIITALQQDNQNNIWFGTNKGIYKYIHHDGIKKELLSYPMKRISGIDIENIFIEKNGIPWFSSKEALFRYNFNNRSSFFPNYYALIRKVTITNDSIIFYGNNKTSFSNGKFKGQNIIHKSALSYNYNSIQFEFAAPSFENEQSNIYQYKLEGFDKQWTSWSKINKKDYTNLPEGTYTFKVKTKNIFNVNGIEAKYKFTIKPPWYRTLLAFIIYGILIILIAFYGLETYSKRLRLANIRLEKIIIGRTSEIEQQKEEIKAQTDKLIQTNKELEKLSIVARETDNAIVIMDPKGNFEWINEGFTRLYGYTFNQLIKEKDRNIIGASSNLNIKDLISIWFGDKKAIIYESLNTTISGEKIWAQTTLTPILNENGKIVKLIAIDSDITKLKAAEEKIEIQRDEIKAQRDIAISQRDEIKQQKQEITDSIIYAKRIQKALLPSNDLINKLIKDYFILYKPRNIVSGDFYWFSKRDKKIVFAAADCTGHGVPGAFMSLIGISFLNEIVNSKKILEADKILNQLRNTIILSLQHSIDNNEAKDGMDIALCVIDESKMELQYAGANNSIIIINNKKLTEIKPDKMPIGRHRLSDVPFTNNRIKIKDDDTIYLFTDGFSDQFGGINDKKFKSQNFKKLLLNIQNVPLKKQKSILDTKFEEWKGNAEQVDDILVMGLKINKIIL